jgi:deoxyribodipyrimidine photolyase-related protein
MGTTAPTTHFGKLLAQAQKGQRQAPKQWLFVAYDQLNMALGPMATVPPKDLGLIFIETTWKPSLRDYHKQKLALLLTNMRHFALEQAQRGHTVRYVASRTSYGQTLAELGHTLGPIDCITPAEHELRCDIAEHVRFVPHNGWLSDAADFARLGAPPWRMEAFYKHMRRKLGIMMDGPQPRGGKWSFDADNRKRWPGTPPAPTPPTFAPDAITQEVCALVQAQFGNHFGVLRPEALPASLADAAAAWDWAQTHCLPLFGPYEDAMSQHSATLFHTLISPLLNLQRLQARQVVDAALSRKDVPLPSLEGFIRQIIGWREFVRHVHTQTDGLQRVPTTNALRATLPLPPAYWGTPSGMNCLDTVVQNVVEHGYSHHITRLMVLSNIATLIAADPRALTDWFWFAYIDAYDWVVEPNVLGMGTFALGDLMITKPYVSGAAYINKMSDYCKGCAFNPAKNCPITPMYWAFLARHQGSLKDNHRMAIPLMGLQRREPGRRDHDARIFAWVQQELTAGRVLTPEGIPTP